MVRSAAWGKGTAERKEKLSWVGTVKSLGGTVRGGAGGDGCNAGGALSAVVLVGGVVVLDAVVVVVVVVAVRGAAGVAAAGAGGTAAPACRQTSGEEALSVLSASSSLLSVAWAAGSRAPSRRSWSQRRIGQASPSLMPRLFLSRKASSSSAQSW
jgi:hypothetical protein